MISAYKHILKTNTSLNNAKERNLLDPDECIQLTKNIRGCDISPVSLVNLYLHGFTNPEIYEYDSLTTKDYWNEYYDVILVNPDFLTIGNAKVVSKELNQNNLSNYESFF